MEHIESAIARHQRIAFQFSGGRDSTAALYLLRPWWGRMSVYHVDTGDQFPELREVVQKVECEVPLVRVHTDAKAVRAMYGMPSDVVPFENTTVGRSLSGLQAHLSDRMSCCWRTLMDPLHRAMKIDGITLIVRGVRADEFAGGLPIRSGHVEDGFELLYPIEDWSAQDVDSYIERHGLPVAPFYRHGMSQAPECMGCTAWWGEGRAQYMRQFHPQAHAQFLDGARTIKREVARQMRLLDKEIDHG